MGEELLGPIWQLLLDRAKSRIPDYSLNPEQGLDNPPALLPAPVQQTPYALHIGGNETTLSLPANKGANFEGYLNYHFNPFSPQDFRVNGAGLRYRYEF